MAFHHRKSLISKPNFTDKFADDSCYLCYVCPDNCYLSPPPPPPPDPSDSSKYHIPTLLILMLCVLGVAFLALSYLTISRYRNSRSRSQPPPSPETLRANFAGENHAAVSDHPIWLIRTVGLPQSVIDSISSFAYRKGDGLIDGDDCIVCLNGFRQNEIVRLLPKCTHAFHLDCIDTWLRSHKNCPVCRAPIVREDGTVESRSSSEGSGGEDVRQNDNDSRETRPIISSESDDMARSEKVGVIGDVADRQVGIESFRREVPPVRRSFSMNLSMTYEVGDEGCSDHTRLRAIEKENSSRVKRSFSFNGKTKNSKITI